MGGLLKTINKLNYSRESQSDGSIKLSIEIQNDRFKVALDKVYARLAPAVKLAGFRPGKAPRNLIIAQLGPTLFEETLRNLIPECTLEVIRHEELTPLSRIAYAVEKVADGSGASYSAAFTAFPEFKLPNLKKIKVRKEKVEVKDDEITAVLKQMYDESKKSISEKKEGTAASKEDKQKQLQMDDAWALSLGLGVKNLDELKKKVGSELQKQKEGMENTRRITEAIAQIYKASHFPLPKLLISEELGKREKEYKARIEKLGMKIEDFLRNQKTTLEELRTTWQKETEERIKSEIILIQIAKEFKLSVSDEEVNNQIALLKDEKLKSEYQTTAGRNYLKSVLEQQKVITKLLESIGS